MSIFEWWNISFSSAYSCVLLWSSPPLQPEAEPSLYNPTSIMSPLFRRYESEGRASFFSRLA